MSNTPETDKAERMAFASEYMVPTEFARELEQQRDEAREDLEFRRGLYKVLDAANSHLMTVNEEAVKLARTLKQERDEAREKYDMEATEHMLAVNKICGERDEWARLCGQFRQERDGVREVLQEIANASHFDNIGNWARNKARQVLEELK